MDLLDNYLGAIRWNLPRGAKADDIMAELRDVIASRIEDREDILGRPLNNDETSAVLRDFGHPLVVAARYGTQQSLIGPDLFPFYWFSLKIVLAISAAVLFVQGVANAVFSQRAAMQVLMRSVDGAWWSLLANAGLVTLIFVVIERTGWLTGYLQDWSPENLPDLSNIPVLGQPKVKPQSAWESAFEVAMGICAILWWIGLIHIPVRTTDGSDLSFTLDPVWTALWAPVLVFLVSSVVSNLVLWLRPRWTIARAVLVVGTTVGGLALLAILYRAGHWLTAVSPTMQPEKLADIDRSINTGLHFAIIGIAILIGIKCAKELWRLYAARG